jgi:D-alanine-D-alanine ligase
MDEKQSITVLYDAAEDIEKAKADEVGKPFPLAYAQVAEALEKRGHNVKTVAVTKKIRSLVTVVDKDDSDVIFNLCEAIASTSQHEHNVVGLLELFEKCFTGCGSAGWLLAGDKALCKKIFQFHGIRYPRFCTFEKGKVKWADELDFPMIVKPLNEDASIGIDKGSVVHNVKELLERISYIHEQFDGATLVEEFIEGREIYVGVLGNDRPEAFPIIEWDFSKVKDSPKIAGSEAKWDRDSEGYKAPVIFPEDIPDDVVRGIHEAAVTAFQSLKLTGYARVDMRLRPPKDSRGWEYFIIEVNPNCWIEKRGEFAAGARKHGLSYPELLEKIIELALARRPKASL